MRMGLKRWCARRHKSTVCRRVCYGDCSALRVGLQETLQITVVDPYSVTSTPLARLGPCNKFRMCAASGCQFVNKNLLGPNVKSVIPLHKEKTRATLGFHSILPHASFKTAPLVQTRSF